jgi:hypothetical protein
MLQKLFNLSGNSKAFDKMLKEIYWHMTLYST